MRRERPVDRKHIKTTRAITIIEAGHTDKRFDIGILLANYITSVLRLKCAILECTTRDLESMHTEDIVFKGKELGFNYENVNYYPGIVIEEVEWRRSVYDVLIILSEGEFNESILSNSEMVLIVGSMRPWVRKEYYEFMHRAIKENIDISLWECYGYGTGDAIIQEFADSYGIRLDELPAYKNPFQLDIDDRLAAEQLLKGRFGPTRRWYSKFVF